MRSGIITNPPPTPNRPDNTPVRPPMIIISSVNIIGESREVLMGRNLRLYRKLGPCRPQSMLLLFPSFVLDQVISLGCRFIRAREPERATEIARPRRGPRHFQPALVDLARFVRVDKNIAVTIFGADVFHCDFLVPAMLAAHRIGLDREGKILMDARVFPENPLGIGVAALERLNAVYLAHHPFSLPGLLQIHERRGPPFTADILFEPPAAEVVRASDDTGPDSFGDPDLVHEVTDLGPNL